MGFLLVVFFIAARGNRRSDRGGSCIYNANVGDFNTRTESFPANLIAGPLGFEPIPFFQSESRATALPEVDLD